jgi:hypothetical protein
MKAKFGGQCSVCHSPIRKGEEMTRFGEKWAHQLCAEAERTRGRILAGETYAGTGPEYRRRVRRQD